MPETLRDAKFGLWAHWGPTSWFRQNIPVKHTHYLSEMYMEERAANAYHKEHYGDPNEVGYKDVIGNFQPKHFDAVHWADTYHDAGARFAGINVMWVDNFAMWDSEVTKWNAADMGPKQDITGLLNAEFAKRDMPVVTTFHSLVSWTWFHRATLFDGKVPGDHVNLYNEPHEKTDPYSDRILNFWENCVFEVLEKYKPTAIYFDYGFGKLSDERRTSFSANYYNWCEKEKVDGTIFHKDGSQIGSVNRERGRFGDLQTFAWMVDTSVGKKFWYINKWRQEEFGIMTGLEVTRMLIDIVSKNGILLLNVAPDANGLFPDDQTQIMKETGEWLKVNGESIYNTRTWGTCAQGPIWQKYRKSARVKGNESEYTNADVNFTTSKDGKILYAIVMARPAAGELLIDGQFKAGEGANIRILGRDGSVGFNVKADGKLAIEVPALSDEKFKKQIPVAFVIEGFDAKAPKLVEGTNNMRPYHAFWKKLQEDAEWLKRNAAAVKEVKPAIVAAEGPHLRSKPARGVNPYHDKDMRFTQSKDGKMTYAIVMKAPKPNSILIIESFFVEREEKPIRLLGYDQPIEYTLNDKMQIEIKVPKLDAKDWPDDSPLVFVLDDFKYTKHYDVK